MKSSRSNEVEVALRVFSNPISLPPAAVVVLNHISTLNVVGSVSPVPPPTIRPLLAASPIA
jgi:hypothetical protein